MPGKIHKEINELRAKIAAGDVTAQAALDNLIHSLLPKSYSGRMTRNYHKGAKMFSGVHVTARTHTPRQAICTEGCANDVAVQTDRLNMLTRRKARRNGQVPAY